MNHFTMMVNSPQLWLGAITFRGRRLDIYEALVAKLDSHGRASVRTVPQIFEEWATRERGRGETLAYVYEYVARRHMGLAEGLRPFVDNDEYLILKGAEHRGKLAEGVQSLIDNMKAKAEM